MRIGIVGAGVSGLVSCKYCLADGHDVSVFEQTGKYGGCWNFTHDVGLDEAGLPVHSSMYENLKTNLPKEIMVFEGLEHKEGLPSYVKQTDVMDYINRYAKKFDLEKEIKYYKRVINIKPHLDTKWILTEEDTTTKKLTEHEFDAIMVCNGHFFHRRLPSLPGMDIFAGVQIHSQDFKTADRFKGKKVVIVGAGPSGVDIAKHTATTAKSVFVSHKSNVTWTIPTADNIIRKPEIEFLDEKGCRFKDGSHQETDIIIYCTGYSYIFPFLKKDSGIVMEDNWVKYVYRHVVNIEHPTMGIMGLTYGNSIFPMVDLMARYFLAHLSRKFALPSKEKMMENAMDEQNYRLKRGWPPRFAHKTPDHGEHLARGLANEAKIKPIPPVIFKLHTFISKSRVDTDCFEIVDDHTFIKTA